jgi:ABC-type transport system involved in multi-copper enzyme maturation permease subunit
MINFSSVWTVAAAELQLTRRLFRYWAFVVSACLLGIASYIYYGALHGFLSDYSGTIALIGPRFLFGAIAFYYLTAFTFGVAFLGFDVRARDQREGIAEVLDARPMSNLELIAGRFLGLFLAAWIPIVVLALLLQGLGWLLGALDAPIGETLEPRSLLSFVVYMAVPAIAFSFALVFLITLLVRNRLIAAVLSLVALYGLFAVVGRLTPALAGFVDYMGYAQIAFPSDLVPRIAMDLTGWLQRLGTLVVALGLLGCAAAVHPRLDDGRRALKLGAGVAVLALGLALLVTTYVRREGQVARLDAWRQAHEQHAQETLPDIIAMRGSVSIAPGRSLDVVLDVQLRAPDQRLERALFTLNPGLTVHEVTTTEGQALKTEHRHGLLTVSLPRTLSPGEGMTIRLKFGGMPELAFGYLDSAIALEKTNINNGTIGLLGYDRAVFDTRFVALMPGIGWLPLPGPDIARDDTRKRPRDYFEVQLEVDLPEQWLAAGPSRREELTKTADHRARYRFAPRAPVPEVALIAAEFRSYSTEIDGVTFEVLAHPAHLRNYEVFAADADQIKEWIRDSLSLARSAGLEYPFDALTLVEVPFSLRAYKGGWRMDTAFGPPAMVLMREAGFPTARFAAATDRSDPNQQTVFQLRRFFTNDFTGGNALVAAAQSFVIHQTAARGPEALALNATVQELAALTLAGNRGYFSAHLFDASFGAKVGDILEQYNDRRPRSASLADVVIKSFASRPEVWERVLSSSLVDIDPSEDPRKAVDIFALKSGALAQLLYEVLGPHGSAQVLGRLAKEHRGQSFSLENVVTALAEAGFADSEPVLDDWLHTTQLPGFVAEKAEVYRIADDARGTPQFQVLVRLRNDEPVPGTVRIAWIESLRNDNVVNPNEVRRVPGELIRMPGQSAVEFGVVLPRTPVSVYVEPSLSLNRGFFIVYTDYQRSTAVEQPKRAATPIQGVTPVPWNPQVGSDSIVVDDLDAGFSVSQAAASEGMRVGGMRLGRVGVQSDVAMDQGLPRAEEGDTPDQWGRAETPAAWGTYRHTMAYTKAGEGQTQAKFSAEIPQAGQWQLEVHLPSLVFNSALATWGTWQFQITNAGDTQTASFDNAAASRGWNQVGMFSLAPGEVTVALSDQSTGRLVVADAIRWSRRASASDRTSAR